MSREEKLQTISTLRSVAGIKAVHRWKKITPNEQGDWIGQRDQSFTQFMVMGDKRSDVTETIFTNYALGLNTNRDVWVFNSSDAQLKRTVKRTIDFYNNELKKAKAGSTGFAEASKDEKEIKWSSSLEAAFNRGQKAAFDSSHLRVSCYRPFFKQWLYFDRMWNHRVSQMPNMFPTADAPNRVIMLKQRWNGFGQFALMVDCISELQTDGGTQCFPIHLYDSANVAEDSGSLFDGESSESARVPLPAVTDVARGYFENAYKKNGASISKEDIFYYVYGLFHSECYRSRYADNISKELPRIPAVKKFEDFQKFAQAGRDLAHWHLNYETVKCHPVTFELSGSVGKLSALKPEQFRVVKMKHPKRKDPQTGKNVPDKSTVIYNEYITVTGIPLEAYDYVVNGKPAIDWVMERQAVTTDKDSGITNDANLWATETMNNPRYPLELLQRVITVSLETMKIVRNLPKLEID